MKKRLKFKRARKEYKFSFWLEDGLANISPEYTGKFTSKDNNGKLMGITFFYNAELTVQEKIKISCYLCKHFGIPCQK